jgi:tetratricopeptide (TPR) repeat protein
MRTAGASRHRGAGIDRSRAELRRAEGFYRRAIERRPDFVEAQIRLGRVLGQLGRHQDAVAQLAAVSALLPKTERLLQYYAQMFLGHEEAALGRRDAARANFQAAAALYPTAQSPLLALSELARRYGDRQGAGGATRALAALPSDEELREEPWWVYTLAQGRHVDVRLAELRRPFRHPPAPERP